LSGARSMMRPIVEAEDNGRPLSSLRLVRALCVETHEAWLEDNRYLNMDLLKEQHRERLRAAA
jgi:hypothetical protein